MGILADAIGPEAALGVSAATLIAAAVVGLLLPVRDPTGVLDPTVVSLVAGEPRLVFEPTPDDPVVVVNRYRVPDLTDEFRVAMWRLGLSRGRSGATRWSFTRSGESGDTYIEQFAFPSWDQHRRGDSERWTGSDVISLDTVAPYLVDSQHLFPVDLPRHPGPPVRSPGSATPSE